MASGIYNAYKLKILSPAGIDFAADTIKVALVTSSYTPDFDNDEYFADIGAEVVGTGYTAGGQTLANKSLTQDNTNNRGVFNADDVQWAGSTITARGAVIYKDTGNAATSPVIGYIDFLTNRSSNGGTFSLLWQSAGIVLAS